MPGNSMTRQHENPRWLKTNKVDYRNLFRSSPLFILVLILLNDSKTYKTNTVCQKLFLINLTGLAFFFHRHVFFFFFNCIHLQHLLIRIWRVPEQRELKVAGNRVFFIFLPVISLIQVIIIHFLRSKFHFEDTYASIIPFLWMDKVKAPEQAVIFNKSCVSNQFN